MKAPAAPWRRLALLAGIVLAAHLALLLPHPEAQRPSGASAIRFQSRMVDAPQPAMVATVAAVPEQPPPGTPAAPAAPAAPAPPANPAPPATPAAPATPAPRATPAMAATLPLAQATHAAVTLPAAAHARASESAPLPTPSAPVNEAMAPVDVAKAATPAREAATGPVAAPKAGGPAPARPFAIPPSTRLRYEVTAHWHGIPVSGQARLDWRQDGQQYEARLEVTSPGLPSRVQRSVGRLGEEGLAPSYFSDKGRSEQATHFERDQGRLVFSNNQPQAPLAPGMQDRLSVVLQLASMVGGQPARFTRGTEIAIPTASTREAETWTFTVEGEEDLVLPGGKVRALKLQRLPRKQYDQKVELWLAPGMDYAPVRLRLTNPGGDAVDQRWASTDRG